MRKVRGAACLALVIAAAALSGGACGGSRDSTAVTLSKPQFIRRADAICTRVEEERTGELGVMATQMLRSGRGTLSHEDQERLAVTVAIPAVVREREQISELGPPGRSKAEIEAILVKLDEGIEAAEADPGRYLTGAIFVNADKALGTYGMTKCVL